MVTQDSSLIFIHDGEGKFHCDINTMTTLRYYVNCEPDEYDEKLHKFTMNGKVYAIQQVTFSNGKQIDNEPPSPPKNLHIN